MGPGPGGFHVLCPGGWHGAGVPCLTSGRGAGAGGSYTVRLDFKFVLV